MGSNRFQGPRLSVNFERTDKALNNCTYVDARERTIQSPQIFSQLLDLLHNNSVPPLPLSPHNPTTPFPILYRVCIQFRVCLIKKCNRQESLAARQTKSELLHIRRTLKERLEYNIRLIDPMSLKKKRALDDKKAPHGKQRKKTRIKRDWMDLHVRLTTLIV